MEHNFSKCNLVILYNYYLNNFTKVIGDVITNPDFNHICNIFGHQEIDYHNPYYFGTRSWFDHNQNLKITIEKINQQFTQMCLNIITYSRTHYPTSNIISIYDDFGNTLTFTFDSENNFNLDIISN